MVQGGLELLEQEDEPVDDVDRLVYLDSGLEFSHKMAKEQIRYPEIEALKSTGFRNPKLNQLVLLNVSSSERFSFWAINFLSFSCP